MLTNTSMSCKDEISVQVYLVGGVPFWWRSESRDSKPGFLPAYHAFDAISPWAVGRYRNNIEFDGLYYGVQKPDKMYVDHLSPISHE